MADNVVEILVKSRDEARPDMAELRDRLQELGRDVETARVGVDDADAAAKLDRLQAKLLELDRKTANPKISMSGAVRAEAEIHAVEASLDNLNRKADAQPRSGGLLSRFLFGAGGAGEEAGGLTGALPGGGMLGGLALAIPMIEAALVEVTGLVSGFAAAGAGAGAFAALALPAFKNISAAQQQISADQDAYNRALTKTAKTNALKHLQQDYKTLDPAQRSVLQGMQQLTGTYHTMAKAFEPDVLKVFNQALKIANQLLPVVTPFADTFASSLDKLLARVATFTESKGFKQWLAQFQSLEGPSLDAIGSGLGKVAVSMGRLLTVMSSKDVVHAINIAFDILTGTLNTLTFVVQRLMTNWDQLSSGFRRTRHEIASVAHDIAHDFDTMRHTVATQGHNMAHDFDVVRHAYATGGHDIATTFDTVRHGAATLAHDVASRFDQIRHDIAGWAADVGRDTGIAVTWFKGLPGRIVAALGNLGGLLVSAGESVMRGLLSGIVSGWNAVAGFVSSVAGKIASLKGPLPKDLTLLVPHGQAIMDGLVNGMNSRLPKLRTQIGTTTAAITALSTRPALTGAPGGYSPAAAAPARVILEIRPGASSGLDEMFWTWLRQGIRVRGGDVQLAIGH